MYRPPCIRDSGGMQQIAAHPFNASTVALMGVGLPAADEPPEWVHLLPTAQGRIETNDGRGPYFVADAAAVIAASFADASELPLDENHATDLTPGAPSPARGWITAMEARADGIWGKVRWTRSGRELVADQAYRGISPVFLHSDDKTVRRILRASLVNNPNLRGLATLHQEGNVNFMEKLAGKLGLNAAATEEQILAALPDKAGQTALQSSLPQLAEALGLDAAATVDAVVAAAKAAGQDAKTTVPALQSQVSTLSGQLKALTDGAKQAAAAAFIDGEIKAGRLGLNAQNREAFIAMHLENPTRTETLVKGFALMPARTHAEGQPDGPALQSNVDDLVSQAKALQAAEMAKGNSIDWITAVRRVSEGKK